MYFTVDRNSRTVLPYNLPNIKVLRVEANGSLNKLCDTSFDHIEEIYIHKANYDGWDEVFLPKLKYVSIWTSASLDLLHFSQNIPPENVPSLKAIQLRYTDSEDLYVLNNYPQVTHLFIPNQNPHIQPLVHIKVLLIHILNNGYISQRLMPEYVEKFPALEKLICYDEVIHFELPESIEHISLNSIVPEAMSLHNSDQVEKTRAFFKYFL